MKKKFNLSNVLTYILPLFLGIQDGVPQVQNFIDANNINIPANVRIGVAAGSLMVGFLIKVVRFFTGNEVKIDPTIGNGDIK